MSRSTFLSLNTYNLLLKTIQMFLTWRNLSKTKGFRAFIFLVQSLMIHFRLDETTETLLISIYSIFMILGLLLNVSIIISFFSKNVSLTLLKYLLMFNNVKIVLSTQNVLIFNLCLADVLLIIFNMPLTLMDLVNMYWDIELFSGIVSS